jgi:hypothetical protein
LSRGYKEVYEPHESRLFLPVFVETTFSVEIINESQLVSSPFPRLSLVPLGFSKGGMFSIRHFESDNQALEDVLLLAKGMTLKNSLAGQWSKTCPASGCRVARGDWRR